MRGVVLGLGAAAVAGLGLGCSDTTGPVARGPQLVLTLETPPSDSLGQLGVSLFVARSDSAPLREARIWVDSAAGGPSTLASDAGCGGFSPTGRVYWAAVSLPGPGRHTVTVVGIDTLGRSLGASAAWTVRVPDEPYAAVALPDSGAGSGTRFIHASGAITGWVIGRNGRRRPAVWRDGALSVVGAVDTLDGAAMRVNAAGDVLLEYSRDTTPYPGARYVLPKGVRVQRADGVTFAVGPNIYRDGTGPSAYSWEACCQTGADLTETRLALGSSPNSPDEPYAAGPNRGPYGAGVYVSAVLDVARGVRVDSMDATFVRLNDAGQGIGTYTYPGLHRGSILVARGFTLHGPPTEDSTTGRSCDPHYAYFGRNDPRFRAIDLDASANVLAAWGASPFWMPASGAPARWLDRVVGASAAIHLSRTGQIVASLDTTGAIYLWRAATNRTTRVQIAGSAWKIDSLAAVNASGQIAAHGVERATGRAAALLLTPATPAPSATRSAVR